MDVATTYLIIIKGLKEYFIKSGFKKAVIGLSGGIDSSLSTLLITDSIGRENLFPIFMPSEFTLKTSKKNSYKLCENLNLELMEINITGIFDKYLEILSNKLIIKKINVPEENLQARIRGNILMYFANREQALVIGTGNRSEILTGYCTLYGDTVGAIAPIGDLYKTEVYEMANWINRRKNNIIPPSILKEKPSAELNVNQLDEDELHPYKILDPILKLYVDEGKSTEEIVNAGFKKEVVRDIIRRVKANEFKRQQLPSVIKIRTVKSSR